MPADARAVVLVEGQSDRIAVETLAAADGRDLGAEGVLVVAIGGAHAIGSHLAGFGPRSGRLVAGLCDAREEDVFRVQLERAGYETGADRAGLERLGFFVCDADLEDELIRAHGAEAVEAVLAANGDLPAFRTLQKQPAWRGQAVEAQLHRFFGSGGSRKARYARLLVESLAPERVPRPLRGVLAHVGASTAPAAP